MTSFILTCIVTIFLTVTNSDAAVPTYYLDPVLSQTKDHGQLEQPVGMAFDASGNAYVVDQGQRAVVKFDAAGNYVKHWTDEIVNPIGIAFYDNQIFVTDVSNRVLIYDLAGTFVESFGSSGDQPGEFGSPQDIEIDDQYIYVVERSNNRVQVFNRSDYTIVDAFGEKGSDPGQFSGANDIAIDTNRNIYVADMFNNRIQLFLFDAGTETWHLGSQLGGMPGHARGEFIQPSSVLLETTGGTDYLYVANRNNFPIQRIEMPSPDFSTVDIAAITASTQYGIRPDDYNLIQNPISGGIYITNRAVIARIGDTTNIGYWIGVSGEQFHSASGVAIDGLNNIYVADEMYHRILKYDSNGNYLASWGSFGTADDELKFPSQVAFGGDIYVVDRENYRVVKYDRDGHFLSTWGTLGDLEGQFSGMHSIAVSRDGHVYVTHLHYVDKFTDTGVFVDRWGVASGGTGEGEFQRPAGMAFDRDGNIYIADRENNRIQQLRPDGTFITQWGSSGSGDGEFNFPTDIAIDWDGHVFVADSGNQRIQQFDTDGVFIQQIGDSSVFKSVAGLAINDVGQILATDPEDHDIKIFSLTNPVSDLTAAGGDLSATLTFSPSPDATFITVKQSVYGTGIWTTAVTSAILTDTSTEAVVTGLLADTTYEFQLEVVGGPHAGISNIAVATTSTGSGTGGVTIIPQTADLERLVVDTGFTKQELDPSQREHTLRVAYDVEEIEVTTVPKQSGAKVTIGDVEVQVDSGKYVPEQVELAVGMNLIEIVVTTSNRTKQKYTLEVIRASSTDRSDVANPFKDIDGHWAQDIIVRAQELGFASGYPDNTFQPNLDVTRAEFVTFIGRYEGWDQNKDSAMLFRDVAEIPDWALGYVSHAVQDGVVLGYEDNTFRGGELITRSEAVVMIMRLLGELSNSETMEAFADDDEIAEWAKPSVYTAVNLGVVAGRGKNLFAPKAPITRAECIALLMNMYQLGLSENE